MYRGTKEWCMLIDVKYPHLILSQKLHRAVQTVQVHNSLCRRTPYEHNSLLFALCNTYQFYFWLFILWSLVKKYIQRRYMILYSFLSAHQHCLGATLNRQFQQNTPTAVWDLDKTQNLCKVRDITKLRFCHMLRLYKCFISPQNRYPYVKTKHDFISLSSPIFLCCLGSQIHWKWWRKYKRKRLDNILFLFPLASPSSSVSH